MARIVLATLGSLGDLHPYLAIARELLVRGHHPVLVTHESYRSHAETLGIEFAPLRPDYTQFGNFAELIREAMDERRGSEVVARKIILPYLRHTRDDLLAAARGADLLIDHILTFPASLVCEQLQLPRVSTTLQPVAMFSAYDPPLFPGAPWMSSLRGFGPPLWRAFWNFGRLATRGWFREIDVMRREMGLPPTREHPMLDGASHDLHLVLFSRELMAPQPDWPAASVQPGFPIHDRDEHGQGMPPALTRWLEAGAPNGAPLVFTLGSSAVYTAGTFYDAAAEAARALGRRAVLLTGHEGMNPVTGVPLIDVAPLDAPVVAVHYAPHSELMPRGCATIHQGGVGTTAQAMRAGRPMLVVPFSHDQPDNAARCRRLGIARVLPRKRISTAAFVRELSALLADADAATQAKLVAERMRQEPGAAGAVDAIEALLAKRANSPR